MTMFVIIIMCMLKVAGAARILFLSYPSFSHSHGELQFAAALVARGHVVWKALPTKLANDKRLHVKGASILRYESTDNFNEEERSEQGVNAYFESSIPALQFDRFKTISNLILRDEKLLNDIKRLDFDLVILDANPLPRMLTIIPYKLNIPFIFYGQIYEAQTSRSPFSMAADPSFVLTASPDMDFITRVLNVLAYSIYYIYDPFCYYDAVSLYAPEKPYVTMETLTAKGLLWLIESEPLLDYPRATLPNVKFIGSLADASSQILPQQYSEFMERAKHGVVIVSFGSKVTTMPMDIAERLVEAFSKNPYSYVFRTEMKLDVSSNVLLTKWMPQSSLLAHPNTRLFITHCGAKGQNEAFLRGIPMIGFPIFAEQRYNSMRLVYNGFGMKMDLKSFKVEELVQAINEIIQNSTYSDNIKKASEIARLRERSPAEEGVYWVDHVIQYGGAHLRSHGQDMPLYQYLCLDVIAFLLILLHLGIFLLWKLCITCVRAFTRLLVKQKNKLD